MTNVKQRRVLEARGLGAAPSARPQPGLGGLSTAARPQHGLGGLSTTARPQHGISTTGEARGVGETRNSLTQNGAADDLRQDDARYDKILHEEKMIGNLMEPLYIYGFVFKYEYSPCR